MLGFQKEILHFWKPQRTLSWVNCWYFAIPWEVFVWVLYRFPLLSSLWKQPSFLAPFLVKRPSTKERGEMAGSKTNTSTYFQLSKPLFSITGDLDWSAPLHVFFYLNFQEFWQNGEIKVLSLSRIQNPTISYSCSCHCAYWSEILCDFQHHLPSTWHQKVIHLHLQGKWTYPHQMKQALTLSLVADDCWKLSSSLTGSWTPCYQMHCLCQ